MKTITCQGLYIQRSDDIIDPREVIKKDRLHSRLTENEKGQLLIILLNTSRTQLDVAESKAC